MKRISNIITVFLAIIFALAFVSFSACSAKKPENTGIQETPSPVGSVDNSAPPQPGNGQENPGDPQGIPPNQPGNLNSNPGNNQGHPPDQPGGNPPPPNQPGQPGGNPPPPNPPGNHGDIPPQPMGTRFYRNKVDDANMVFIPAGKFKMGVSPGDTEAMSDELPLRDVSTDGYYIYTREVTVYQFQKFVEATRYYTTAEKAGSPVVWRQMRRSGMMPAVCVSYDDAQAYCKWAGGRLPTEAEWEKAARGMDDARKYPWGDTFEKNFFNSELMDFEKWSRVRPRGASGHGLVETGRMQDGRSPFQVEDMIGNAWEWVSDWYSRDYQIPPDAVNPTGPPSGQEKLLKGGGTEANPIVFRISGRKHAAPDCYDPSWGFRCVLDKNAIDENGQ
ncbi:MAG: formylglycine-generating enzyme family protein [Firmicutes bacterium]|nr:formylglycine-generating enzyme family protein [Bacillota bacterium]